MSRRLFPTTTLTSLRVRRYLDLFSAHVNTFLLCLELLCHILPLYRPSRTDSICLVLSQPSQQPASLQLQWYPASNQALP